MEFKEFESYQEINEAAEKLFNDPDMPEGMIYALAKENGISEEYAKAYINGEIPYLCDAGTAAVAKIEVERTKTVLEGIMEDWISYIEAECLEDEQFAIAVRRKGVSLNGCIAELMLASLRNQKQVDPEIISIVQKRVKQEGIDLKKECGIEPGWLQYTKVGFPGMGKARKIIRDYYMGGQR